MPDRAAIYTEARRWVGTPYHHHGRRINQSCDCIGLIIGVGRELGLSFPSDAEIPKYSALPHDGMCEKMADKYLARQSVSDPAPGQVGLFFVTMRGVGQHFCIFAWHEKTQRNTMIHAFENGRHVIETGISDFWRKRLIRIYDYREYANA
jgi:NlpC/P60 family putative phage cell wall peptidase